MCIRTPATRLGYPPQWKLCPIFSRYHNSVIRISSTDRLCFKHPLLSWTFSPIMDSKPNHMLSLHTCNAVSLEGHWKTEPRGFRIYVVLFWETMTVTLRRGVSQSATLSKEPCGTYAWIESTPKDVSFNERYPPSVEARWEGGLVATKKRKKRKDI